MYPRDVAVRVLTRVLSDRQALDEALNAAFGEVEPGMRGWLHEVCSGTLRWKGRLDHVIDSAALKKKPSGWLRKVLLIGAYQLVAQERTQPGAVVSETVDVVKRREGDAPSRFANAILRKIGAHAAEWRNWVPEPNAPFVEKSQWASLPDWLWKRIAKQHGEEWARAYAAASLERPTLWIRSREPGFAPEGAEPGSVPGSFKIAAGEGSPVTQRPGFAEGRFFVQDISSQFLVQQAARAARSVASGKAPRALDLCAAPGGKSAGLAAEGIEVTAGDRDEARLALLRETVARVAPSVRVLGAGESPGPGAGFDLVWIDAPCSGSGILRRHPDVRWLKREADLPVLQALQIDLLRTGWSHVRPGGFLMYSVCSVLKEEGSEALEKAGLGGQVRETWALAPHLPPHGDGFWAALIAKA